MHENILITYFSKNNYRLCVSVCVNIIANGNVPSTENANATY